MSDQSVCGALNLASSSVIHPLQNAALSCIRKPKLVTKLDRLSRNLAFIATLILPMRRDLFVAADEVIE
jgi:hypothetical protein